jgi:hypothetical protein
MLALSSAAQAQNPTLVLVLLALVLMAIFWRTVAQFMIAAVIIGFALLFATGLVELLRALHALAALIR